LDPFYFASQSINAIGNWSQVRNISSVANTFRRSATSRAFGVRASQFDPGRGPWDDVLICRWSDILCEPHGDGGFYSSQLQQPAAASFCFHPWLAIFGLAVSELFLVVFWILSSYFDWL